MITGVGHTVAEPFQLGAKPSEWVWMRGSGKALKLGPGHPQTCSTHSLLHLTDTLSNCLLPVAWASTP